MRHYVALGGLGLYVEPNARGRLLGKPQLEPVQQELLLAAPARCGDSARVRPSVAGRCASIIRMAAKFSDADLGGRGRREGRSGAFKVTCRQ